MNSKPDGKSRATRSAILRAPTTRCWLGAVASLAICGCKTLVPQLPTRAAVAHKAAAEADEPRRLAWEAWGKQHLCDGDILFVRGESRILMGLLDFSKFSAEIAGSPYSHVGIVAIEDGEPVVYDVISEAAKRRPFGAYLVDRRVWSIAVRRLEPGSRQAIPAALEFCREVYRKGNQFDDDFVLDDDRYYCAEFVEVAFRRGGRSLSDAIRIDALPNFDRLSPATICLVQAGTSLTRDRFVYMPGNEQYGIWSSPALTLVLENTSSSSPPPLESVARLPVPSTR